MTEYGTCKWNSSGSLSHSLSLAGFWENKSWLIAISESQNKSNLKSESIISIYKPFKAQNSNSKTLTKLTLMIYFFKIKHGSIKTCIFLVNLKQINVIKVIAFYIIDIVNYSCC